MVRTGLEQLLRDADRLEGRRYALLAHGAAISSDGTPAHLALAQAGQPAAALFGPEHGFYGIEQDMVAAAGGEDPLTGVPLLSLYGENACSLRPRGDAFAGLDLLVVDLQDVGSRYYTYVATAVWAARAAAAAGCEIWVLDRPNPIGGLEIEGSLLRPGFESFVGAFEIPVRHGLTVGELVLYLADGEPWSEAVRVWPMEGWRRGMTWAETSLPWIPPSPNMPTVETARIYPGGCLVEATELSEGRGTTRPFHLVGAPHLSPAELADRLHGVELPGVRFVPTYFRPQFQKHAGRVCGGVEILVQDPQVFRPYRTGIELLRAAHACDPRGFAWRAKPYEFVDAIPAIDLLTGSSAFRQALESGEGASRRLDAWLDSWPEEERRFAEGARGFWIYEG